MIDHARQHFAKHSLRCRFLCDEHGQATAVDVFDKFVWPAYEALRIEGVDLTPDQFKERLRDTAAAKLNKAGRGHEMHLLLMAVAEIDRAKRTIRVSE